MPKLPQVKSARLIRALQRAGFYVDHVTGSHHILYKDDRSPPVSIPHHNRDLKPGTLKDILKQARLSVVQLNRLL